MSIVKTEAKRLVKGELLLIILTYGVFSLFGYYGFNILLSLLFGSVYSILNFLLIGFFINKALSQEARNAQGYMAGGYFLRYALSAVVIYLGIKISYFNSVAVIVPLFFPKLLIVARAIFSKKGG